jgi:hypothetical protein
VELFLGATSDNSLSLRQYMASTQATKEAIWMTKLMKELGYMKEKKVKVI